MVKVDRNSIVKIVKIDSRCILPYVSVYAALSRLKCKLLPSCSCRFSSTCSAPAVELFLLNMRYRLFLTDISCETFLLRRIFLRESNFLFFLGSLYAKQITLAFTVSVTGLTATLVIEALKCWVVGATTIVFFRQFSLHL